MRVFYASLLAMVTYAGGASAQEVGSRVRVRDSTREVIGTLLRLDADSIVVRADKRVFVEGVLVDDDVAFPITADIHMDMSVERRGKGGKGATIGAGVGLGIAALMGIAAAASYDENSIGSSNPGPVFLGGVVLFMPVGALIGYAVGSASKTDIWSEVPLQLPPVGDPYEVTEGMIQLGLRINF